MARDPNWDPQQDILLDEGESLIEREGVEQVGLAVEELLDPVLGFGTDRRPRLSP